VRGIGFFAAVCADNASANNDAIIRARVIMMKSLIGISINRSLWSRLFAGDSMAISQKSRDHRERF
jgi:hypothetical protein